MTEPEAAAISTETDPPPTTSASQKPPKSPSKWRPIQRYLSTRRAARAISTPGTKETLPPTPNNRSSSRRSRRSASPATPVRSSSSRFQFLKRSTSQKKKKDRSASAPIRARQDEPENRILAEDSSRTLAVANTTTANIPPTPQTAALSTPSPTAKPAPVETTTRGPPILGGISRLPVRRQSEDSSAPQSASSSRRGSAENSTTTGPAPTTADQEPPPSPSTSDDPPTLIPPPTPTRSTTADPPTILPQTPTYHEDDADDLDYSLRTDDNNMDHVDPPTILPQTPTDHDENDPDDLDYTPTGGVDDPPTIVAQDSPRPANDHHDADLDALLLDSPAPGPGDPEDPPTILPQTPTQYDEEDDDSQDGMIYHVTLPADFGMNKQEEQRKLSMTAVYSASPTPSGRGGNDYYYNDEEEGEEDDDVENVDKYSYGYDEDLDDRGGDYDDEEGGPYSNRDPSHYDEEEEDSQDGIIYHVTLPSDFGQGQQTKHQEQRRLSPLPAGLMAQYEDQYDDDDGEDYGSQERDDEEEEDDDEDGMINYVSLSSHFGKTKKPQEDSEEEDNEEDAKQRQQRRLSTAAVGPNGHDDDDEDDDEESTEEEEDASEDCMINYVAMPTPENKTEAPPTSSARQRAKAAENALRQRLDRLQQSRSPPPEGGNSQDSSLTGPNEEAAPKPAATPVVLPLKPLVPATSTTPEVFVLNETTIEELCQCNDVAKIQQACRQLETAIVKSLAEQQEQNQQMALASPNGGSKERKTPSSVAATPDSKPEPHVTTPVTPQEPEPTDPHHQPPFIPLAAETRQLLDWEIRLQNRLLALHKKKQSTYRKLQNHQMDEIVQQAKQDLYDNAKQMSLVHCRLASLWAWYNDDEMHADALNPNDAQQYQHQQRAQSHIEQALEWSEGDAPEEYKILRLEARLLQKWQEWQRAIDTLEKAQEVLQRTIPTATPEQLETLDETDREQWDQETEAVKLKVHYETCSILVEIAALLAKLGQVWKAIYLLKDCVKEMMQHQQPPNPAKDYQLQQQQLHQQQQLQLQEEVNMLAVQEDNTNVYEEGVDPTLPPIKQSFSKSTTGGSPTNGGTSSGSATFSSSLEQDRIYATVYGKLGMLLLQVKRPRKAAAFLAMALELTWSVYNRRVKDRKTRQMAEKLSKALCQTIAMMDQEMSNTNNANPPSPEPERPPTPEPVVVVPPVKTEEAPPPPPPPAPIIQVNPHVYPFTVPRREYFNTRTWWLVDFQSALDPYDDDFEEPEEEETAETTTTETPLNKESSLDTQGATPLALRCMRAYEWDEAYTRRVMSAYRQFLWLKTDQQDWNATRVSPCTPVNLMWKEHLVDLKNYYHDCMILCDGHVLNYNPDENAPQHQEAREVRLNVTRAVLEDQFGDKYDAELWMDVGPVLSKSRGRRKRNASLSPSRRSASRSASPAWRGVPPSRSDASLGSIQEGGIS